MRLASVQIQDFRSCFVDDRGQPLRLELGPGMNTLVGPNNCGKSNVLRAVAMALDPAYPFDPTSDLAATRPFSPPIVTLCFTAGRRRAEDPVALAAAAAYESALGATTTHAAAGEIHLQVSYLPSGEGAYVRTESILTPDHRVADPANEDHRRLLTAALDRLRDAVRFVLVRSGESLESVLEGNFREILHSVIRERLDEDFQKAEQSRQDYIDGLRNSVLAPLKAQLAEEVAGLFPEIGAVELAPDVSTIESTLSHVGISLNDIVETPLAGKGTGVRGGVLVSMLHYLARNATRTMVFAVEEPEAFLHPAAQEELRDHLEQLAIDEDATLLVTTHSPFVLSRSGDGRVFALDKDTDGRTRIAARGSGQDPHAALVGGLFRDSTFEDLLRLSAELPDSAAAVLLVEGDGDRQCLRLTAERLGRPDLLEGLHIQPAGGTQRIVSAAIVAGAGTDRPVMVLLDNDQDGQHALDLLSGKFAFMNVTKKLTDGKGPPANRMVVTYAGVFAPDRRNFPYEAEDLFEPSLIQGFVGLHGTSVIDGSLKRPDDAFHYDLNTSAKELLGEHLRLHTGPEHLLLWAELLLALRTKLGLAVPDTAAAVLVAEAAAPETGTSGRDVLVLTAPADSTRYSEHDAILVDPTRQQFPETVTHVGFYVQAAIQPVIPAVRAVYEGIVLTETTAAQLAATGKDDDGCAAEVVRSLVAADDSLKGAVWRLVLLTPPGDPRTLHLDHEVRNTKQLNGRPLAWTVGPRLVPFAALAGGPATTEELEAFEAGVEGEERR